ncbi:MAG: biotin--[acetyl-CoA-carboxylase] ligase, partial [Gammaproteobacteria bacterium]
GLSLLSGLAAVDALRRAGIEGIGLKWPNDLIAEGKKLGGVLTELRGGDCVIGIGLNVMMPPMARAWTNLQALGYEIDRDALAAGLIISHCRLLRRFCSGGFAQFVDAWQRLNVHHGRAVSAQSPRARIDGIARGIDERGALLIERRGEVRRVISGEVSLREPARER